jgi:GTP cyclohydrolase I
VANIGAGVNIYVNTQLEGSAKVSIRPEDIILSKGTFTSSARNMHQGRVTDIIRDSSSAKGGQVVGISKIARVTEVLARRPQLQERLTSQIADCIYDTLKPYGVAVIIEAEHMCMTMRGINKPGSLTVTSAVRGIFETRAQTRNELLSLIMKK